MLNNREVKGFTLIELMVVVGVMSILLAVGLPSLRDTINRVTTNNQAKALAASLNFARSEAVKHRTNVTVCGSTSGTDCAAASWSDGWIVFVDSNGDANGGAGSVDAGDTVLRVYQGLGGSVLTFTTALQQYDSQGYGINTAVQTFLLCPADGDSANAQALELSMTGRGRRIHTGLNCA